MFKAKILDLQQQLRKKYGLIQDFCRDFRLYDLGTITLNKLTPQKGYATRKNVAYGLKARQRLDLYISEQTGSKPLIVFVHGGAWVHGDKSAYKFVGEAFTRFGYDVAVLNYHLAPKHKFPSYIDDLALALGYLETQQAKLGISTQNIALMGHSSGAFNVASLLYHPQRYSWAVKKNIKALIGISGPYHFDYKGDPLAQDAFDQSVPYQEVMPYYFVEKNQIQHYLFIAEKDHVVKNSNTLDLQQKLQQVGNHCEVKVIPNTGHISIMSSVSSLFSYFYTTRLEIIKALDATLKKDA